MVKPKFNSSLISVLNATMATPPPITIPGKRKPHRATDTNNKKPRATHPTPSTVPAPQPAQAPEILYNIKGQLANIIQHSTSQKNSAISAQLLTSVVSSLAGAPAPSSVTQVQISTTQSQPVVAPPKPAVPTTVVATTSSASHAMSHLQLPHPSQLTEGIKNVFKLDQHPAASLGASSENKEPLPSSPPPVPPSSGGLLNDTVETVTSSFDSKLRFMAGMTGDTQFTFYLQKVHMYFNTPTSPLLTDTPTSPLLTDTPTSPLLTDTPTSPLLTDTPTSPLLTDPSTSPLLTDTPTSPLLTDPPTSPLLTDPSTSPLLTDTPTSPLLTDTPINTPSV